MRCLSCTWHAYWSSTFLPNIIKMCLRVSKLWSTQGWGYNFCYRRDNYVMNKVRVVSLACNMPTGPPHPYQYYQIISNSMGVMAWTRFWLQGRWLHNKDSESCLSCMWCLLVLLYIPSKYYQNMSKGIKVMERTRMHRQTDAMLIAISPEPIGQGIKRLLCTWWIRLVYGNHLNFSF